MKVQIHATPFDHDQQLPQQLHRRTYEALKDSLAAHYIDKFMEIHQESRPLQTTSFTDIIDVSIHISHNLKFKRNLLCVVDLSEDTLRFAKSDEFFKHWRCHPEPTFKRVPLLRALRV